MCTPWFGNTAKALVISSSVASAAPSATGRYGGIGEVRPSFLRVGDDLFRAELIHHPYRRNVARLFERVTQGDRALELMVVILRRVRRLTGAGVETHRRVVRSDAGV